MQIVYKKLGETPLECLERHRKEEKINDNVPMTYAGRLDPMAEGKIVILVGEECKEKQKYLALDKTYEFEVLLGFSTDTYDLLGVVKETSDNFSGLLLGEIKKIIEETKGKSTQAYPPFSSKTVEGRQLFEYARENSKVTLPSHEVEVYKSKYLGERMVTATVLKKEIIERISLVRGDFRQEEIKEKWEKILTSSPEREFPVLKFVMSVSSGFYIRQFVHDISKQAHFPLVTFSINRTTVEITELIDFEPEK